MSTPFRPTLIELPEELVGARVLLRPYRTSDAEQVFAAIDESREHLKPWMPWVNNHLRVDDTLDYCLRSASNWLLRSDLAVGIFDQSSGRFLGGSGLHDPDWDLRAFETGYWLRASAVGRGYMTETVRLLVGFAFAALRAQRVHLGCEASNVASQRVAERAGFLLEGRLRNGLLATSGQPVDMLVFALTPEDWSRLR